MGRDSHAHVDNPNLPHSRTDRAASRFGSVVGPEREIKLYLVVAKGTNFGNFPA